jgi:hypothetical protein
MSKAILWCAIQHRYSVTVNQSLWLSKTFEVVTPTWQLGNLVSVASFINISPWLAKMCLLPVLLELRRLPIRYIPASSMRLHTEHIRGHL